METIFNGQLENNCSVRIIDYTHTGYEPSFTCHGQCYASVGSIGLIGATGSTGSFGPIGSFGPVGLTGTTGCVSRPSQKMQESFFQAKQKYNEINIENENKLQEFREKYCKFVPPAALCIKIIFNIDNRNQFEETLEWFKEIKNNDDINISGNAPTYNRIKGEIKADKLDEYNNIIKETDELNKLNRSKFDNLVEQMEQIMPRIREICTDSAWEEQLLVYNDKRANIPDDFYEYKDEHVDGDISVEFHCGTTLYQQLYANGTIERLVKNKQF